VRAALVIPVLALVACTANAGAPRRAAAHDGRLAAVVASLERLAKAHRFSGDVLVAKRGRPVLERAYGFANRATGERNSLGTRFNLASVGKTLTAVAIGRLVDEGKLRFGDTIGRYLPGLPRRLGDRITVAELLDHTSGLGDFFASPDYERLRPTLTSLERYLPLIVSAPAGAPKAGFHYSNSGYILLGLIVERASGLDYYRFLRREVFARAGMTSSGCFRSDRLTRGIAVGYTPVPGTNRFLPNTSELPPRGTSAGGCYSTVRDLLRFVDALLGDRLLSANVMRTLTSPKVDVGPGEKYGYGFGIRYGKPGDPPTIWHDGGGPGVGAELDFNPTLGYTVIVLSNFDYPVIGPAIDQILNRLRIP
jgi:CubicO group peptidase (beta-lactamase class C family)